MAATYPTKLLLAFRSGEMCAFPNCGTRLTIDKKDGDDPDIIGEAAHIVGGKPGAARHDSKMKAEELNSYPNLIYLCPNHHAQIDKQEDEFPVSRLRQMKMEHERKVRDAMNDAFAEVGFEELNRVTQWVEEVPPQREEETYNAVPPWHKIKKNKLSRASIVTIKMGLAVSKQVRRFLESEAQIDSDFPDRLKNGFLTEYLKLRKEGARGDDLFDLMCAFAQKGFESQSSKSAALAVVVYLFESCDIFEK